MMASVCLLSDSVRRSVPAWTGELYIRQLEAFEEVISSLCIHIYTLSTFLDTKTGDSFQVNLLLVVQIELFSAPITHHAYDTSRRGNR